MYLDKVPITWSDTFQTEESFPIEADIQAIGYLPNGVKVNILVDSGVSKSFMFKSFYLNDRYLHIVP